MPSYYNNDYYERDRRGRDGVHFRSSSTHHRSPSQPRRRSPSQPRVSERSYTVELESGNAVLVSENHSLKTQLSIHEARTRTQSTEIGRLEDRIRQLELDATLRERDYVLLQDKFEAADEHRREAEEKARLLKRWTPTQSSMRERFEDSVTKDRLEVKIEDLRAMVHERDERIRHLDVKVKTRDKSIAYLKQFLEDMGYKVDVNV
jgi:chromosome segregation ATPase